MNLAAKVPCAVIRARRRDSRTAKDGVYQCVKRLVEGWKDPRVLNWALRSRAHLLATWSIGHHLGGYHIPRLHHARDQFTMSQWLFQVVSYHPWAITLLCATKHKFQWKIPVAVELNPIPNSWSTRSVPLTWALPSLCLSVTHPTHPQLSPIVHYNSSSSDFSETGHHRRREVLRRGQSFLGELNPLWLMF
jgi:hypothetical protein